VLQPGQLVRVNLAGLQTEGVMFQAAVTDAVGHIVKQTSEQPPKYLVKLLFSFRGVTEVEVPADRIHADKKWNREPEHPHSFCEAVKKPSEFQSCKIKSLP
jgi:hypothetical protein